MKSELLSNRHVELPTFRDRDSSGPRRFGTRGDVSGARYRQFGSWIKMKY